MATPKKRQSHCVTRQRRSHDKLAPINLQDCPSCKEKILPHRVCPFCGYYKGKKVISIKEAKPKTK
ncbi:MAG: 50S ribosomal protein L32 [SAR324 cluster bacterium]|nr:50S ribosomal protein L32 [SAR324 cluster bacterium]